MLNRYVNAAPGQCLRILGEEPYSMEPASCLSISGALPCGGCLPVMREPPSQAVVPRHSSSIAFTAPTQASTPAPVQRLTDTPASSSSSDPSYLAANTAFVGSSSPAARQHVLKLGNSGSVPTVRSLPAPVNPVSAMTPAATPAKINSDSVLRQSRDVDSGKRRLVELVKRLSVRCIFSTLSDSPCMTMSNGHTTADCLNQKQKAVWHQGVEIKKGHKYKATRPPQTAWPPKGWCNTCAMPLGFIGLSHGAWNSGTSGNSTLENGCALGEFVWALFALVYHRDRDLCLQHHQIKLDDMQDLRTFRSALFVSNLSMTSLSC